MLENYCFCDICNCVWDGGFLTRFVQYIQVASTMRLSNLTCPSYFNYGKGKDLQQATYICWPMKFSSRKTLQENSRILCLIPYFTRWIFFVKNIIGAISVFSSGWHSLTTGEVKSAQSKLKNQFWKFFQHSKWAPHHCWALDHTSYLSILVHRRIIEVYKKYTKKLSELATK